MIRYDLQHPCLADIDVVYYSEEGGGRCIYVFTDKRTVWVEAPAKSLKVKASIWQRAIPLNRLPKDAELCLSATPDACALGTPKPFSDDALKSFALMCLTESFRKLKQTT